MINEVFLSTQGEGIRAGTLNVFLRFSKCNMQCALTAGPKSPGGFDCDTEFESGRRLTLQEVVEVVDGLWPRGADKPSGKGMRRGDPWVVCTGGEPALQLDLELCNALHVAGFKIAVETNGSLTLPTMECIHEHYGLADSWEDVRGNYGDTDQALMAHLQNFAVDWITVSPKVAEHAVRQLWAHELKYVRGDGQGVPQPAASALYQLISPAFAGNDPDPAAVQWCTKLARENPEWRLCAQLHKLWRVR